MENIENVIIDILKSKNSYDSDTAVDIDEIFEESKKKGIENINLIESFLIKMIDKDIIEYEMDDHCKMNVIWLISKN